MGTKLSKLNRYINKITFSVVINIIPIIILQSEIQYCDNNKIKVKKNEALN